MCFGFAVKVVLHSERSDRAESDRRRSEFDSRVIRLRKSIIDLDRAQSLTYFETKSLIRMQFGFDSHRSS